MGNTYRTDVAGEVYRHLSGPVDGIKFERIDICGVKTEKVTVSDAAAAEKLGKPVGNYYTLALGRELYRDSPDFAQAATALCRVIRELAPLSPDDSVLVAALGNPDITPDAVGSIAASSVLVTGHLKKDSRFADFRSVYLCRTGVLGTTGVESALQIKALCRELKPQTVIAVDALAGSDINALCRTVQVCNTGISPGSGVGNDRAALDEAFLGVPVIAVGAPTVIDASTLCDAENCADLFVTPRGIDSMVRDVGRIIAYGINLALHEKLTVEDVDGLVG